MAGECIPFDGTRNAAGYGVLPKAVDGSRLAHRAILAQKLGRPVQGVARHACDNPPCINPEHLLEGTQAENVADAVARGRVARGPRKQTCVRGHDVARFGRGHGGQCNECRRVDTANRAARRKQERHSRGLQRPTPIRFRKAA